MVNDIELFYFLALLQREGWGTAYEYWVKSLLLEKVLPERKALTRVLIAGLPEKYGLSLDFLLFSQRRSSHCVIVDDRYDRLEELKGLCRELVKLKLLKQGSFDFRVSHGRYLMEGLSFDQPFDLALSCESIQRFTGEIQPLIVKKLLELSKRSLLFFPNANHQGHRLKSHLSGVRKQDVQHWVSRIAGARIRNAGYLDMPFWPAGIKAGKLNDSFILKSNAAVKAVSGILRLWSQIDRRLPFSMRERNCHMIYADIESRRALCNPGG